LLKTSADLFVKQLEYEKTLLLTAEAGRALELIGRAIRMAGYRNVKNISHTSNHKKSHLDIEVHKRVGYQGSDSLVVRHELSDSMDFDCLGNALTSDRTKNHLALQGFLVDKQAGFPKGAKVNGGSLMCQSLDRQGRLQNTTLMNGVNVLKIEEIAIQAESGRRAFKVRLEMTDGDRLQREFERTFTARNLL
jgi:hypothetical protein